MRHLGSILLAAVLTPIIYAAVGLGETKLLAHQLTSHAGWRGVAAGFAALAIAGLLYAVLVLARLSPLGLVLAGAALVVVTVWGFADATGLRKTLPHSVLGVSGATTAPIASGVAALLAVPLLLTIFSPRRWRRSPNAGAGGDGYSAYEAPQPFSYPPPPPAPSYGQSPYSDPAEPLHTPYP